MPSTHPSRRDVLAATGAAALGSLAGCVGSLVGGIERTYERDAPVGAVDGAWPTYQHDFANTGHTVDAAGPWPDPPVERVAAIPTHFATVVSVVDRAGFVGVGRDDDVESDRDAYYRVPLAGGPPAWRSTYQHGKATPTVAGDAVFVSAAEFLAAYDAADGALCWKHRGGGHGSLANAPVLVGDTLVEHGGGGVTGYDARTGERRWQFAASPALPTPNVAARDGVAYAPAGDPDVEDSYGIVALAAESGEEQWRRDDIRPGWSPLVVDADNVYVADERGTVRALARGDGSTRWRSSVASGERSAPWVAVADGLVHVQSPTPGGLAAFDAASGEEVWRTALSGTDPVGPPAVAGTTRFTLAEGSVRASLHALDAATGTEQWAVALGFDLPARTALSVAGDAAYVVGYGTDAGGVYRVGSPP